MIIPGHGHVQHGAGYLGRTLLGGTVDAVREAHDEGVSYAELSDVIDLGAFEIKLPRAVQSMHGPSILFRHHPGAASDSGI